MSVRSELPPLTERLARRPVDHRGYPVPWFVSWIDGEPDFRVVDPEKIVRALRLGLCWVCGETIGSRRVAFTIGPMCAVNRTSGEPPAHVDCADYSARACPFLSRPHAKRRTNDLPEDGAFHPAALQRNPGVALVWITRRWTAFRSPVGGILFDVGEPTETRWYAEGRPATRAEVEASIDSGLPLLESMARDEGPKAIAELTRLHAAALAFLPA